VVGPDILGRCRFGHDCGLRELAQRNFQ
jgi:hypothetical protein